LSHSDLHGGGEERLRPTAGAGRLTQPRHRYGRGGNGATQGTPEEGLDLLEKIPQCYKNPVEGSHISYFKTFLYVSSRHSTV
jgi:hypothetical protein